MTSSPRRSAVSLAAALAALCVSTGLAEVSYQVTPLESLGEPGSWAWDLNNAGQIVGHAYTPAQPMPGTDLWVSSTRAVLWSDGVAEELGTLPGGSVSIAHGVNDGGQVVGRSRTGTAGPASAFLWDGGVMTPLATPAGFESEAFAVNAGGTAVGMLMAEGGDVLQDARAARWSDGVMNELAADEDWHASAAQAVNATGDVVGWYTTGYPAPQRAVLWSAAGEAQDLGTLNDAPFALARAMNDAGAVVGNSGYEWAPGNWVYRAFLWQDGQMDDLGSLGGMASEAYDVNAAGHVVGMAETADGDQHAFLWDGQQMVDLNDRLPAGSGWELRQATGINDAGQVVGYGFYDGQTMAFQLNAIPEPCPADINGDGSVDVMDLVQVIMNWGNCPDAGPCSADTDFDDQVGTSDLVEVITAWGTCHAGM